MKKLYLFVLVGLVCSSCEVVYAQWTGTPNPNHPYFRSAVAESIFAKQRFAMYTGASERYLSLTAAASAHGYVIAYDSTDKTWKAAAGSGAATAWSALTAPTSNLIIYHDYPTEFNWTYDTSIGDDGLTLTNTQSAGAPYGSILRIRTDAGSQMKPITITAQGLDGVEMTSDGILQSINGGVINADQVNGNYPLAAADIPATVAYKNANNNFSVAQAITSAVADALTASSTFVTGTGVVGHGTTGYGGRFDATSGYGLFANSTTGTPLRVAVNNVDKFGVYSNRVESSHPLWMSDKDIRLIGSSTYPRIVFYDTVPPDSGEIKLNSVGGLRFSPFFSMPDYASVIPTGGIASNGNDVYHQESIGKMKFASEGDVYPQGSFYVLRGDTALIPFTGAVSTDIVAAWWNPSKPGSGELVVEPGTNQYYVYSIMPGQLDSVTFNIEIKDKVR